MSAFFVFSLLLAVVLSIAEAKSIPEVPNLKASSVAFQKKVEAHLRDNLF